MKKITFVCAIAMIVAFALPAQAAVQNVKVSGDITIRGIYRESMDLVRTDVNDTEQFIMSSVGVNVEADLTDNVSATIRLVNQRDITQPNATLMDFGVDLAYITLKEMLYSPLTIIVGRQDLWYGDGFIVGSSMVQTDNATTAPAAITWRDPENTIGADEFTEYNSFDAIRAILDYDPWTIDLLYAKLDENTAGASDDTDLWGVNVGYVFGEYDAEAEAYWFLKYDGQTTTTPALNDDEIHTIGLRGSMAPLENLDLRGEVAYQFGERIDTNRNRDAWAVDARGEYCWVDYAWIPTLGLEYIYLSGENAAVGGDFEGWDPMYVGKTVSALRDYHEWMYRTTQLGAANDNIPIARCSGLTNAHKIIVDGSIQPTDDVLIEGKYGHFIWDETPVAGRDDEIGDEVDLKLTYEYTEDVTLSLLAAWFFPGRYFTTDLDDTQSEVVGTVSLVF